MFVCASVFLKFPSSTFCHCYYKCVVYVYLYVDLCLFIVCRCPVFTLQCVRVPQCELHHVTPNPLTQHVRGDGEDKRWGQACCGCGLWCGQHGIECVTWRRECGAYCGYGWEDAMWGCAFGCVVLGLAGLILPLLYIYSLFLSALSAFLY